MSSPVYTFFRVIMYKELLSFSCNVALEIVYYFLYNRLCWEKVWQYQPAPLHVKLSGRGDVDVPLTYKVDILQALKGKGYNTNVLRKDKLLAESTVQKLREGKPISWANISQICRLLGCQPGDILEYVPDEALEQDNATPATEEKEDV